MSIERTDRWLEKYFYDPVKIFSQYVVSSEERNAADLYKYLLAFGMYKPNRTTEKIFDQLQQEGIWSKVELIFNQYQKRWNGPDIPLYIFPINYLYTSEKKGKSGVSFNDRMFLFLTPALDEKELEALIVHEYHHVCRLNQLVKPFHEYTLLDSIVMEGFAEYAVVKYCGSSYGAKWLSYYTDKELEFYWEKLVKKYKQVKRTEYFHEVLLYGKGQYPKLLGYAVGYWLVTKINKEKRLEIKETFSIQAEELIKQLDMIE